jgi:hypothetical protein
MVVDPPPSVVIEEKEIKVDRGGDVLGTAVHSWKTEIAYTEKTKNHRVINTFQSKPRFRQQRRARASPSIRPAPRPALPSRTLTHARGRGTGNPRFFVPLFVFPAVFSARRRDRLCQRMEWTPRDGDGRWCADVRVRGCRSVSGVGREPAEGKRTSGEFVFPTDRTSPTTCSRPFV